MVYLALRNDVRPARRHDIAVAEDISEDYVEQILVKLKMRGLVTSLRGARGGFSLARAAATISVKDVLEAVEGPVLLVPCAAERCRQLSACVTRSVWRQANEALLEVFGRTTLGMLADQARALRPAGSFAFEI
jgi:Rrf2 family transcriptional regulator, cysteine metabolism repressor